MKTSKQKTNLPDKVVIEMLTKASLREKVMETLYKNNPNIETRRQWKIAKAILNSWLQAFEDRDLHKV